MLDTISFASAAENMVYDEKLLAQLPVGGRRFRAYVWQQPGVTISYKQAALDGLEDLDVTTRFTGGGAVFHCPGDIVLSCVSWLDDPLFVGKLKDKVGVVRDWVRDGLTSCGVVAVGHESQAPRDLAFCQTYHSPYELAVDGHKVVALTLRKAKDRVMIQGIIHLQRTADWFSLSSAYDAVMVDHPIAIDSASLLQALEQVLH